MKRNQRSVMDKLADKMAEALVANLDALTETPEIAQPAGTVAVSRKEQLEQYYMVKESPAAWAKMIQERGPKAVIEYAQAMQRLEVSAGGGDGESDGG